MIFLYSLIFLWKFDSFDVLKIFILILIIETLPTKHNSTVLWIVYFIFYEAQYSQDLIWLTARLCHPSELNILYHFQWIYIFFFQQYSSISISIYWDNYNTCHCYFFPTSMSTIHLSLSNRAHCMLKIPCSREHLSNREWVSLKKTKTKS